MQNLIREIEKMALTSAGALIRDEIEKMAVSSLGRHITDYGNAKFVTGHVLDDSGYVAWADDGCACHYIRGSRWKKQYQQHAGSKG